MIDSIAALLCSQDEPLRTLEEQTELGLFVANSSNLRAAVLSDQIDLAVVVANKSEDDKLKTAAVGSEKLALVCHALSAKVFQAMLDSGQELPFIAYVQTSTTHRIVMSTLEEDGISTRTILYSTSPDVMLQMALRGRGATILPENLVALKIQSGELKHLVYKGTPYRISRQLSLVAMKGRRMPPSMAGLAWAVTKQLKSLAVERV